MKNRKELPLRIGVGIVLLNHENKVFVGKRIDNPTNLWQMPQGGIDKNEKNLEAAKRELKEETGITEVKLIKELDYWLEYELPNDLIGKINDSNLPHIGGGPDFCIIEYNAEMDKIIADRRLESITESEKNESMERSSSQAR